MAYFQQTHDVTSLPAWQALREQRGQMNDFSMREAFARDPQRFTRFSLSSSGLLLDYSKNLIDEETLGLIRFENCAIADSGEGLGLLVVNRIEFCNFTGHAVWGLKEAIGGFVRLDTPVAFDAPDGRPVYTHPTGPVVFDLLLDNLKDGGSSTSVALTGQKTWRDGVFEGLDVRSTYTYTESEDGNPMTSSQPDSSYVRFASADHNNPVLATSDYEIRHKFTVNANYTRAFFGDTTHPEAGLRFAGYARALAEAGLPLDPQLPATPYDLEPGIENLSTLAGAILSVLQTLQTRPLAYEGESNDTVFRHVSPKHKRETEKSSYGSRADLDMHVDNPHLPLTCEPVSQLSACPEYLSLTGLRCELDVPTRIVAIDEVLAILPACVEEELLRPNFTVRRPASFGKQGNVLEIVPLLYRSATGDLYCR